MNPKVIGIIGVLLLVLAAALIILELTTNEKSVIQAIGGAGMLIILGALVLGTSRRKASGDPSDTPKR
jgi:membrane-bound ClpP family serine protease